MSRAVKSLLYVSLLFWLIEAGQSHQDTPAAHGSPLGENEVKLTKEKLNYPNDETFFIPDEDILMAIKTAVARGVRVRLLVPRHVANKIVDSAKRTYYGELLEAGVHIYEYDKGMLHAKQMVIDDEIAVVGAANWDMRSFRLNYETCEVIYSDDVVKELTRQFEYDLSDSLQVKVDDLVQRSIPQRIIEQSARVFSPLL